jgi:signal transduction histidine kinase
VVPVPITALVAPPGEDAAVISQDPPDAGRTDGQVPLPLASLRELRHEVGNALTPALGHVQRLQRSLPAWAGEDERETLEAIRESVSRAMRLLETAAATPPTERCNLVTALAAMAEERFGDTQVRITTAVPLVGTWPESHVVQVLINLLLNAAKYSPAGTPIEVTLDAPIRTGDGGDAGGGGPVGAPKRADRAIVLVQDYGIGVPPEDAERIFEGHRTDRARACAAGDGIRLRLSRRRAESVGGRLWVERRGAATTFILELPLHPG